MFGEFLDRLHGRLKGFRPLERLGIIRDIATRLRDGETEEKVAAHAKDAYGKLSPEQWQAIIQLILQILPFILALFGL